MLLHLQRQDSEQNGCAPNGPSVFVGDGKWDNIFENSYNINELLNCPDTTQVERS